jgi:hypothetical protein
VLTFLSDPKLLKIKNMKKVTVLNNERCKKISESQNSKSKMERNLFLYWLSKMNETNDLKKAFLVELFIRMFLLLGFPTIKYNFPLYKIAHM